METKTLFISRGITVSCIDCCKVFDFIYDAEINIKHDNFELFKGGVSKIPYLEFFCPKCKRKMTMASNAIGRLAKAIDIFITYGEMFVNNNTRFSQEIVVAKDNGDILQDGNLIHSYDYPSITYKFNENYKHRLKFLHVILMTINTNEFLYDFKPLISIETSMDNCTLTLSLIKENINYSFMNRDRYPNDTNNLVDYMKDIFTRLLDKCAETVEKYPDVNSENIISKYTELLGEPARKYKYISNDENKSV